MSASNWDISRVSPLPQPAAHGNMPSGATEGLLSVMGMGPKRKAGHPRGAFGNIPQLG